MNGDGATCYQYPSADVINSYAGRRLPGARWTDRM
jgi:hypothetical protein